MRRRVAFISGHIDLTREEFAQEYIPHIDQAIAEGCIFVVGNALGCDRHALEYLSKRVDKKRVTIYHRESPYDKIHKEHLTLAEIRALGYENIRTGYSSFVERDHRMTLESDYDIAWVRPNHETEKILMEGSGKPNRLSGTLKNIQRRRMMNPCCTHVQ